MQLSNNCALGRARATLRSGTRAGAGRAQRMIALAGDTRDQSLVLSEGY